MGINEKIKNFLKKKGNERAGKETDEFLDDVSDETSREKRSAESDFPSYGVYGEYEEETEGEGGGKEKKPKRSFSLPKKGKTVVFVSSVLVVGAVFGAYVLLSGDEEKIVEKRPPSLPKKFTVKKTRNKKRAARPEIDVSATSVPGKDGVFVSRVGVGKSTRKEAEKRKTVVSVPSSSAAAAPLMKKKERKKRKSVVSSSENPFKAIRSMNDKEIDLVFKKFTNDRLNKEIALIKRELKKRFEEECKVARGETAPTRTPLLPYRPKRTPITLSVVRKRGASVKVSTVRKKVPTVKIDELITSIGDIDSSAKKDKKRKKLPPWPSLKIDGTACDSQGCVAWTNFGTLESGSKIGERFEVESVDGNSVTLVLKDDANGIAGRRRYEYRGSAL